MDLASSSVAKAKSWKPGFAALIRGSEFLE